jgi:hypothetical protein
MSMLFVLLCPTPNTNFLEMLVTYSLVSVILVNGANGCSVEIVLGGDDALEPCLDDILLLGN